MYKHALALSIVVVIVLAFWFVLGFIVPIFFFDSISESGTFGDSFGGVNALFSGLGFIALTYTILLQIETGTEQKHQERFQLYLKLIDDVKLDIYSLEWGNLKGIAVIDAFIKNLKNSVRIDANEVNHFITHFSNITIQLSSLLVLIRGDKALGKFERKILNNKIIGIYLFNVKSLYDNVKLFSYSNKFYKELKGAVADFTDQIKELSEQIKADGIE